MTIARVALSLCVVSALLGLVVAPAAAEQCTYTDLLGTFQVSADCAGLEDHSNLGNEQKRLWLAGDWGEVNIIEVPQPYKQDPGQLDLIISNLGRAYTAQRSPGGIQTTTVAGQDARFALEHKKRTSSRSYVFHWQGRNLILRAVAYGNKKAARMTQLDAMSEAMLGSFVAYSAPVASASPADEPRVRDREVAEEAPVEEAPVEEPAPPVEDEAAE